MSDPMAPPAGQPPAPAPATSPQMPSFLASLGRAELFMAAGAALLVLTDLYAIFFAYGVSNVVWVSAVVSLLFLFMRGRMPASLMANSVTVLVVAGAVVALLAVRQVLIDVVFIATPPAGLSPERLLGMIGFYAGAALMGFGAWQLWGRK